MLAALTEAVLRSLILALMVWAGLRLFRVQNVISQRCAWTAVLIGSLLMPIVLPFTARWHVLPSATISNPLLHGALQPAQVTSPSIAPSSAPRLNNSANPLTLREPDGTSGTATKTASRMLVYGPFSSSLRSREPIILPVHSVPAGMQFSTLRFVLLSYFLIAFLMLVRLFFGLTSALRLWHSSTPIAPRDNPNIDTDLNLRFSHRLSTPVTIGSGVVLPADFTNWTEEKLRIVLAHERSHVNLHDFHVQILASIYAALTWFSPLGWFLKHKLSELGEAISDRSGLKAASSRTAYAQVLLEFGAMPRPMPIGVAMARPTSISRRIERLLDDSYLRRAFAGGARASFAVLVVPALLFAGAALIRVHAATQPEPQASAPNSAIVASPATAMTLISSSSAALRVSQSSALPIADSPSATSQTAALAFPPAPPNPPAAVENTASQSEVTFDRTLSFNGKLDLSVGTASGNLTFTRGSANQIQIHGIVKANKGGDPAQVQQIAANPPIEQNGNTIRIGAHGENLHNISISYEIQAPADSALNAATASGNITNTGVGDGAKMTSASGNITASGLEGGFTVQTGSGNIAAEGAGTGDVKAQTGSGNIDLKGVNGALKAQTGSGTIKATGKPSSPWKLQAGSGNIELTTGNAAMDLDASTGSGSISSSAAGAMQSSNDRHHLHTQLNGGGVEVRVETGSGDIRVD